MILTNDPVNLLTGLEQEKDGVIGRLCSTRDHNALGCRALKSLDRGAHLSIMDDGFIEILFRPGRSVWI